MPVGPRRPKAASSDLDPATVSAMTETIEASQTSSRQAAFASQGGARRSSAIRSVLQWLLVIMMVLGAGPALAHPVAPNGEPGARESAALELTVTVILAKKGEPRPIPEDLKTLARYLGSSFKGYGDFSLVARHPVNVRGGQPATVQLPNGTTLLMRHDGVRDGYHHLHLEVGGLKTTVHVTPGATFFQAGRAWQDGMIVLAFEAAR